MELKTKKKVKILFINSSDKLCRVKTKFVIGLNKTIKDKTGKEYQLFSQDEIKYYVDLKINNPNVGVIIDKHFWKIASHDTFRLKFEKIEDFVSQQDLMSHHLRAIEQVKEYKMETMEN
ncbi:MAG: hypothetical protein ABFD07_01900 [Methanobacterium sp.]